MLPSEEKYTHLVHPELFHYTDKFGLNGIFSTQSLWATRYNCLNDSEEVFQIKPLLIQALARRWKEHLLESRKSNFALRLKITKRGGSGRAATDYAISAIDSLYRVSFEGNPGSVAYTTPFITSFCTHAGDSDYERHNGLLSQWRGYGRDSGFAIVFDTKSLWDSSSVKNSEARGKADVSRVLK